MVTLKLVRPSEVEKENHGPFSLGWDWDRRARSPWFNVFDDPPTRSGLYEVRGAGLETALRTYTLGRGWNYHPDEGDEWRGLRKCFFQKYKAPYREKRSPEEPLSSVLRTG